MITRLEGRLERVADGRAEVRCGALCYELLVPAFEEMRLGPAVGQMIELHTLHYLESPNQGSTFIPRLIAFGSPQDRAFFELFTTVKGIGPRKALRAMQMAPGTIAVAISERDLNLLRSLPEIGRKLAETLVLELREKMGPFLGGTAQESGPATTADPRAALARDAIAVLVQLGESPLAARQLAERALRADSQLATADDLLRAALVLRET
jgi:Holliday junction DNA helicase RuvA